MNSFCEFSSETDKKEYTESSTVKASCLAEQTSIVTICIAVQKGEKMFKKENKCLYRSDLQGNDCYHLADVFLYQLCQHGSQKVSVFLSG